MESLPQNPEFRKNPENYFVAFKLNKHTCAKSIIYFISL